MAGSYDKPSRVNVRDCEHFGKKKKKKKFSGTPFEKHICWCCGGAYARVLLLFCCWFIFDSRLLAAVFFLHKLRPSRHHRSHFNQLGPKMKLIASLLLLFACCAQGWLHQRAVQPNVLFHRPSSSQFSLHTPQTTLCMSKRDYSPSGAYKKKKNNAVDTLKEKLTSAGTSGLLAYGILNFLYYSIVTAATWHFTMSRYPIATGIVFSRRLQLTMAKLGSVAGIVWAGSQVTKIFRISGAIVLAPIVDKFMIWWQTKFKLKTRNDAFWAIISCMWATLILFYGSLILYGAAVSIPSLSVSIP